MLSIHSKDENDFIKSLIDSSTNYWLGAIQLSANVLSFAWSDGSDFNYSNWKPGQPNGNYGNAHDCVAITIDKLGWMDRTCFELHRQICQTSILTNDASLYETFPIHYVLGLTWNQLRLLKNDKILTDNMEKINK
ncbi:perlucin 5-like protein, partial [Dinothrombium tinctorium]